MLKVISRKVLRLFKEELDRIASSVINSNVLQSSSISFASGLPGGVAIAATIPADMAQFTDTL